MIVKLTGEVISSYEFFFFKQKTAYEMRMSDWSSDVCSSDLEVADGLVAVHIAELEAVERGDGAELGVGLEDEVAEETQVLAALGCLAEIGRASCRERVCQYV